MLNYKELVGTIWDCKLSRVEAEDYVKKALEEMVDKVLESRHARHLYLEDANDRARLRELLLGENT